MNSLWGVGVGEGAASGSMKHRWTGKAMGKVHAGRTSVAHELSTLAMQWRGVTKTEERRITPTQRPSMQQPPCSPGRAVKELLSNLFRRGERGAVVRNRVHRGLLCPSL